MQLRHMSKNDLIIRMPLTQFEDPSIRRQIGGKATKTLFMTVDFGLFWAGLPGAFADIGAAYHSLHHAKKDQHQLSPGQHLHCKMNNGEKKISKEKCLSLFEFSRQ